MGGILKKLDGYYTYISAWTGVAVAFASMVHGGFDYQNLHVSAVDPKQFGGILWAAVVVTFHRRAIQKSIDAAQIVQSTPVEPPVQSVIVKGGAQ